MFYVSLIFYLTDRRCSSGMVGDSKIPNSLSTKMVMWSSVEKGDGFSVLDFPLSTLVKHQCVYKLPIGTKDLSQHLSITVN